MFSWQVCVVGYCFPDRFVLAISLSGLFFQAGLCWLSIFLVCSSRQVYVVGYSLCWLLFCRDSRILHVLLGKFVLLAIVLSSKFVLTCSSWQVCCWVFCSSWRVGYCMFFQASVCCWLLFFHKCRDQILIRLFVVLSFDILTLYVISKKPVQIRFEIIGQTLVFLYGLCWCS